jgi:hypothetical protein
VLLFLLLPVIIPSKEISVKDWITVLPSANAASSNKEVWFGFIIRINVTEANTSMMNLNLNMPECDRQYNYAVWHLS